MLIRGNLWVGILLVAIAAASLLLLPRILQLVPVTSTDLLIRYQAVAWVVALPLTVLTFALHRKIAWRYLRLNRFAGTIAPVRWLGIGPNQDWKRQGWQMGFVVALVTGVVVFLQVANISLAPRLILDVLPLAVALAASNSLAEELIFRHCIVTFFDGHSWRRHAPLVSGLLFGVPHFFGVPGGIIGVFMAAFLGWLLAKSMQETGGIFWAWVIHFLLDVIIFAALLLRMVAL